MSEKRSTGPNARPKDETIAQSGEGLPDGTGRIPQEVTEADEVAARRSLEELGEAGKQRRNPEEKEREASRAEDEPRKEANGER